MGCSIACKRSVTPKNRGTKVYYAATPLRVLHCISSEYDSEEQIGKGGLYINGYFRMVCLQSNRVMCMYVFFPNSSVTQEHRSRDKWYYRCLNNAKGVWKNCRFWCKNGNFNCEKEGSCKIPDEEMVSEDCQLLLSFFPFLFTFYAVPMTLPCYFDWCFFNSLTENAELSGMSKQHFLSAGKDMKGRLTLKLAYTAFIIAFESTVAFLWIT